MSYASFAHLDFFIWLKQREELFGLVDCPACNGLGYKPEGLQPTCGQCAGSGKIPDSR